MGQDYEIEKKKTMNSGINWAFNVIKYIVAYINNSDL